MRTPTLAIPAAAWLLLLGTASAVPASPPEELPTADPAAPWVTVDAAGVTKTVTPVPTVIDGVATILNAAPEATDAPSAELVPADGTLAGGDAAPGVDTGAGAGAGAGGRHECHNLDGPFKPFCLPKHRDVYFAGSTHYGASLPLSPSSPLRPLTTANSLVLRP